MTVPEAVEPERREKKQSLLTTFGPGLITGASDDDPSGIATYSQVGAQFGYGLLSGRDPESVRSGYAAPPGKGISGPDEGVDPVRVPGTWDTEPEGARHAAPQLDPFPSSDAPPPRRDHGDRE